MLAARITLLLAAVAVFAAQGAVAQPYTSVADAATKLNLTSLLAAVNAANLTDTFVNPGFLGVVLAPSNAAFAALGSSAPAGDQLKSVLLYHVLAAPALPTSFPASVPSALPSGNTTNGNVTFLSTADSNTLLVLGVAPGAKLQLNNTVTAAGGNATVYIIDAVLLPPSTSVPPIKTEEYLSVPDAVAANANLTALLAYVTNPNFTDILTLLSNKDLACTVFAPTNEAFANLTAGLEAPLPTEVVRRVLQNHVVLTPLLSTQVPATPTALTTASNDTLTAMTENGSVVIMPNNATKATVTTPDIKAGKCVVHVVDQVLVPTTSASNTCWLAVVADADGPAPPPVGAPAYASVGAALLALDGFSTLAGLVSAAGLNDTLNDPNLMAIVFAPTDEAFDEVDTASLASDYAKAVLQYHVVPTNSSLQRLNTTSIQILQTATNSTPPANITGITTTITVTPLSETEVLLSGIAPGVKVNLTGAVAAGNATIYPITAVLLPPTTPPLANLTIAGLAQNTANLTILTGLVVNDTELAPVATNPDTAVTVFAPIDSAFLALAQQLQAANQSLPASGSPQANLVLRTHILSIPYVSTDLPEGDTTVTTLSGQNVTITKSGNNVSIKGPGNNESIPVVAADQEAGKSVVHVINGVILPDFNRVPPPAPPGTTSPPPPVNGGGGSGGSLINGTAPPPPPPAGGAATTASTSTLLMVLSALLGAVMMVTMATGSATRM